MSLRTQPVRTWRLLLATLPRTVRHRLSRQMTPCRPRQQLQTMALRKPWLATRTIALFVPYLVPANRKRHRLLLHSVAIAIASSIDLNTLDALARTSRGIHNDLIQYRTMLLQSTLRCRNDTPPASDSPSTSTGHDMKCSNIHQTSFRSCARDMVDECRRCGDVVCRVSLSPHPRHPI